MEVRCRDCGRIFAITYDKQLCCPDCTARHKSTTIAVRSCRACGASFPGGPRARCCPDCRLERRRRADRAYYRRRLHGETRPLGSTDRCTLCGRDYVVGSSRQRYCPDCAPAEYRRLDAEASRAYIRDHGITQKVSEQYRAARIPIPCTVCGAPFIPNNQSHKCPNCRKKPEA